MHNVGVIKVIKLFILPSWLATKLNRRKGGQKEVRDSSPVKPSKLTKFLVSLPCCGIAKLILTGICIIVTVVISTESKDEQTEARLDCLVFVTIYISFALSGLVDRKPVVRTNFPLLLMVWEYWTDTVCVCLLTSVNICIS